MSVHLQRSPADLHPRCKTRRSRQEQRRTTRPSATCATPACSWLARRLSPVWPTAAGACQCQRVNVWKGSDWSASVFCVCRADKALLRSAVPPAGDCEAPKQVLHGKVQEHSLNTGRAVEVQCDKGYDLVGEPLVVCIGGIAWSTAFPTCQRESRRLQKHQHAVQNKMVSHVSVLCSQALPASPRLEGQWWRRQTGLPGRLPRRTVGPGHLSPGS